MKKFLLIVILFSFVLVGCAKNASKDIDVNAITDLTTLQEAVAQVSQEMGSGTISMEKAQDLLDQLQQKYIDLTNVTQNTIETTFDTLQKTFDENSMPSYSLPLRARKLGMTTPQGMVLDKALSQRNTLDASGSNSTILVYTGPYTIAMQQAQNIAQKAHLSVSKGFKQAQSLAKVGNVNYISGLDIGGLSKGIVYVNHELLDTNVDDLLSVSVDQNGTLTIEATRYK